MEFEETGESDAEEGADDSNGPLLPLPLNVNLPHLGPFAPEGKRDPAHVDADKIKAVIAILTPEQRAEKRALKHFGLADLDELSENCHLVADFTDVVAG
eukprot:gene722-2146_t